MNNPDFRAMCAELVDAWASGKQLASVIVRARALLDRPEPADGEWRTGLPPFAGFYYVRELLDQSIGGDNRAVYVNPEHFVWGFSEWDDPEWIGLDSDITPGNIQWKPANSAPQPVAVSERLPGPEDCDAGGGCWWWRSDGVEEFWELTCVSDPISHNSKCAENVSYGPWLPANAIPTPEATE